MIAPIKNNEAFNAATSGLYMKSNSAVVNDGWIDAEVQCFRYDTSYNCRYSTSGQNNLDRINEQHNRSIHLCAFSSRKKNQYESCVYQRSSHPPQEAGCEVRQSKEYITKYDRYASFNNTEKYFPATISPYTMASAGFYYSGFRDLVYCFKCNGKLKDWGIGDTPWKEHAIFSPKYTFLIHEKGEEFIEDIQPSIKPAASVSGQSNPEKFLNIVDEQMKIRNYLIDKGYSDIKITLAIQTFYGINSDVH